MPSRSVRAIMALFILAALAVTVMVGFIISQNNTFRKECVAKGGIPFLPRNARICLKPDAVIRIVNGVPN